MLFDLKQKTKQKNFVDFIAGAAPKAFDPLLEATLHAAYYMNYTTDLPAGSINPNLAARQWLNMKTLSLVAKYWRNNNNNVVTPLNGFNAMTTVAATSMLDVPPHDMLDGVTTFTYLIGFKKIGLVPVGAQYLAYARNDLHTILFYVRMYATGKLEPNISTGAVFNQFISNEVYSDDLPHCLICVVNQTTKTLKLYTDKGESLSQTTPTLTMPIAFNMVVSNDCTLVNDRIGNSAFYPGLFGDVLIFNADPSLSDINKLMAWECSRLGIAHVVF